MILSYGAFWGTAYAGYEMVATPGYYVHQWHLTNGDLVRPLWVSLSAYFDCPLKGPGKKEKRKGKKKKSRQKGERGEKQGGKKKAPTDLLQLILVYGCCYSVVLPLIKTAILLDWCRVFISNNRYKNLFWWSCIILSVLQCLWAVACVILLNLQCRPHHAIWEFYVPAKCYDLPSVMLGSGSVQVATDVIMVLLPQRIIWRLHMNWQRKLGISIIFGVGLVACVAACIRLAHTVTFSKEPDRMYFIGPLLFWAWGEMTAGYFILSVPCLPKLAAGLNLPSRVRSFFGLSYPTGAANGNSAGGHSNPLVTIGGTGASNKRRFSKSALDTYHEIENGMAMGSESQEHLRQEHGANQTNHPARDDHRAIHVTQSTHVTVTKKDSSSDLSENLTPWVR